MSSTLSTSAVLVTLDRCCNWSLVVVQVKTFQEWFAEQQAVQAKRKPHEEPAYKSEAAGARLDELRKAFATLKNRKKVCAAGRVVSRRSVYQLICPTNGACTRAVGTRPAAGIDCSRSRAPAQAAAAASNGRQRHRQRHGQRDGRGRCGQGGRQEGQGGRRCQGRRPKGGGPKVLGCESWH